MYRNMSEPNITAMSTIRTCSSQLVASTFSSVMDVVHQFCTWIAPSDVGLCVSLLLVRKANADEEGTTLVVSLSSPTLISPQLWLTVLQ
jgi:hypothetical protein